MEPAHPSIPSIGIPSLAECAIHTSRYAEAELVARFLKGDPESVRAFSKLVQHTSERVSNKFSSSPWGRSLRRVLDRTDLTQIILTKFLSGSVSFDPHGGSKLSSFLYLIARNEMLRRMGHSSTKRTVSLEETPLTYTLGQSAPPRHKPRDLALTPKTLIDDEAEKIRIECADRATSLLSKLNPHDQLQLRRYLFCQHPRDAEASAEAIEIRQLVLQLREVKPRPYFMRCREDTLRHRAAMRTLENSAWRNSAEILWQQDPALLVSLVYERPLQRERTLLFIEEQGYHKKFERLVARFGAGGKNQFRLVPCPSRFQQEPEKTPGAK